MIDVGNWIVQHICVTNLGLSDKYPMIFFTGEVFFPLHGAIVLAFGLVQYDANPFPRSKKGGANIGNSTALTLPDHLHYRANLGYTEEWETVSN